MGKWELKRIGWFICFIGFILVLSIVFTGMHRPEKASKVKEIEFWTLQLSDFSPYINKIIKSYERQHPDIRIKWVDVPFSEGEKRALAAVMSKHVPDLINMNPSFGSTLASRGTLVDVKKYVNKEDYDKYLKESWDTSSIKSITFGIPWYVTTSITIYNSKMFMDAGLNPDSPPQTYEELGKIAKIMKAKTGDYAFMPNLTEDGQIIKIFAKYDVPIVKISQTKENISFTKAVFNTDKAAKILDFWVNLYSNNYIPPESITETHRSSLERYQAGESALILTGANFLKMIKSDAPQIYKVTKVAPQITGSNKKFDFALMNLVVPIKSSHQKEAVDFALYLTNPQNQLEFCKLAPVLPSTVKTLNSNFFKEHNKDDIIAKARAISANQLKHALKPIPTLQNQKDLFEIADYATQQALLKKKTSKEALDEAVNDWNKILKP